MTPLDLASYALALMAIALAPGPMLILLIARAASDDILGAAGFALGAAMGSLTIIASVCQGLSLWLADVPAVLGASKYVLLAYLLWIARDIWQGGFDISAAQPVRRSGARLAVLAGFATCVSSPYMLVLFPLILPELLDITSIQMPDFLVIAGTTFLAEAAAAGLVVLLAAQLQRLARLPRGQLYLNRGLAGALVIGGGSMVFL